MNGPEIAARILALAETKGIRRTTLGEALGTPRSASRQAKYQNLNRFLNDLKKNILDGNGIRRMAQYFEKPEKELLYGDEIPRQGSNMYFGTGDNVQTLGTGNDISAGQSSSLFEQVLKMDTEDLHDLQQYIDLVLKRRKRLSNP